MRLKIYNLLVNEIPGINYRYHEYHDEATGVRKVLSWFYLLWMNFAYRVLRVKKYEIMPGREIYETIEPPVGISESEHYAKKYPAITIDDIYEAVGKYEVVSFDIFDTLIFRPFSDPTDVFYLIGEKLDLMDFKNQRKKAEVRARQKSLVENGHSEVTLREIWEELNAETGWDIENGMAAECETELDICRANPFMKKLWDKLRMEGKTIIITSDMYLPAKLLDDILRGQGFDGYKELYLSCDLRINKASGSLYEHVKKDMGTTSIVHIGDNDASDVLNARKSGIEAIHYPNVNAEGRIYRPGDMSYIVGSAYRGIVNTSIYNRNAIFSREYEYGFIYGGLFVLGYCYYIHELFENRGIDKILFLSRDGDILKQVYDNIYGPDNTVYVYWSRKAALKLMAAYDRHDYFRRFVDHKVGSGCSIENVLRSMELDKFIPLVGEGGMKLDEELTSNNKAKLRVFVESRWDEVISEYSVQQEAAKKYYEDALKGSKRAAVVDIGWAGSGFVSLKYLVKNAWHIPCELIGVVAGTNSINNFEADVSEAFLQNGSLCAYMFSSGYNRDVWKKHNPNVNHNVYWELLLSSPTPQFKGFCSGDRTNLSFGEADYNSEGMKEIQKGILDFSKTYSEYFKNYSYMFRISGRDAYAPLLAVYGNKAEYLKSIEQLFEFELGVN
ncbi:HAD family hydrolase [Butyrivibrio sp. FC2001]|uniref:HAD family hydrolase n=1 Tax=Butyrivibrio sp. FC2001 TaxID=1280671 RepID=UPI0012DC4CAD|nr:hypothetical protein [Butyrivibrio sp. FC2001]